ncbi:MAG: Tex family protein [Andreesenia angusta]|nr:Tex family protein [Andreesenia angusta]
MDRIENRLSREFGIDEKQIIETVKLIDNKNTIPFIARYRKEITGGLSDEVLRDLDERLKYLRNLVERKEEVKRLIDEQDKLTEELIREIESAESMQKIEDIYRPFRPKKRTRASVAREKGLEPLADLILSQDLDESEIEEHSERFLNDEVESFEEALNGAMDIIAEDIADDMVNREKVRDRLFKESTINTEEIESDEDNSRYRMYFEYSEGISSIVNHRILAINRAEKEKAIRVKIDPLEESIFEELKKRILKKNANKYLIMAIEDGYKRLLFPSIEREIRNTLTERAEEQAIKVFGNNLKPLLMQSPVLDKVVMGIDPGNRTGCKVAVVDSTGKLLDYTVVYPTLPKKDIKNTKIKLKEMIEKYDIDLIAIGNGTGSRETEAVIAEMINEMSREVYYTIVDEAGASIYSASKLATEEYPELDVTIRGAISIGKRIQDPLAELVKIEPKHIGVGQYQHDLNQKKLDETLSGVVESCVNTVGVDLNTASSSLLNYVSGINNTVSKNIIDYRNENGKFKTREELLKVKRLGKATFKQCAGFLRILDSKNLLDRTAVHPESYDIAFSLLEKIGENNISKLNFSQKDIEDLAKELEVGVPTLKDIIEELKKPGRDPREEMPKIEFKSDILTIEDLKIGMILKGTVRNVVDFGAFIDIGLKNQGLVHISEISDRYIEDISKEISVGDMVDIKIIDIDIERERVQLSIKGAKIN